MLEAKVKLRRGHNQLVVMVLDMLLAGLVLHMLLCHDQPWHGTVGAPGVGDCHVSRRGVALFSHA